MSQFPYDSQSPYGYDSSQSANPYGYQQQPPMQNPYGPYAPGMPNPYAPWGPHPITGVPYSEKSKLVAGLLGIFLGYLGAGRFYTGHYGLAVCQLLFGWATLFIWPLIDGIVLLSTDSTDSEGRLLRS